MVKDGKDLKFSSYCCPRKGVEETINMLEQYLYVGWIICKKNPWAESPREWNKECGVEALIGPQSPAQQ